MKRTVMVKSALSILCLAAAVSIAACDVSGLIGGNTATATTEATDSSTKYTLPTSSSETDPTYETTEETDEPVTGNPYERFIDDFKTAVKGKAGTWYYGPDASYGSEQPPEGAIGMPLTYNWGNSFSYLVFDLDGDGSDELLIGEQWQTGGDEVHVRIIGLVTMSGNDYRIIASGWEKSDLEYLGGGMFYRTETVDSNNKVLSIYEYNIEYKCLDLVCELEIQYTDGETEGFPDSAEYIYYEGRGGLSKSEVLYRGQEAQDEFFNHKKAAAEEDNELIGRDWTKEPFN